MAKARLRVVDFFAPEMRYIHEVRFDSHEECWPVLANSFTVVNWDMTGGWHEYVDWLMQTDFTWAYREYADFLRVQKSFRLGMERAMAVRERVGEGQFFDVDFRKLLDDPRRVIDGITDHFNLTPVGHGDMDAYLNLERNDERGNHRYSAEDYGLSEEDIRAYFRNYIERFGL